MKREVYIIHMHTYIYNTYKSHFLIIFIFFSDVPIEKRTIPSQVFGSLKIVEDEDD